MKPIFKTLVLTLALSLTTATVQPAAATPIAIVEIIRQGIKKVIKAVDLKVQRLQNKTIWLQNAQKTLENILSKLKLKEISEWTEKQRKLYDRYFEELWKVKNAIAQYQRVKDIAQKQAQLVEEYQRAWNLLRQDPNFTAAELQAMEEVYSGILDASIENLDRILLVVDAFTTQMSDAERLALIHQAEKDIEKNLTDLRQFNGHNIQLSLSRGTTDSQIQKLEQRYGLD